MQAIILAAGQGTRIANFWNLPKCLLCLGQETIMQRQLKSLKKIGVEEVIVVLGYMADLVKERIATYSEIPLIKYVYNQDYATKGNTHSLYLGLKAADDDVVILDGDLYFNHEILAEAAENMGNVFVVGPGTLDDVECAKTLIDKSKGNVRLLIDKRAVTPQELERLEFVGEAMGIIFVDKGSLWDLLNWTGRFLGLAENVQKNWEHCFNFCLHDMCFKHHFSGSSDWKEIDTEGDMNEAHALLAR